MICSLGSLNLPAILLQDPLPVESAPLPAHSRAMKNVHFYLFRSNTQRYCCDSDRAVASASRLSLVSRPWCATRCSAAKLRSRCIISGRRWGRDTMTNGPIPVFA